MGNVQSTTMKQVAQIVNDTSINYVQTVNNNQGQNCTIAQNISVAICPTFVAYGKGNINLSNVATNQCNFTATAITNLTSNIQTTIQNILQQVATSQQQAVNQFLATALNIQNTNITNIAQLTNRITQNVNVSAANSCISNNNITQNSTISICGTYYSDLDLNISNNAAQVATGMCLANTIFQGILSDTTLNSIIQQSDAKLSAENQGIFSFFGGLVGFVIALIVFLIILGLIGLAVYYLFFRNKGTTTSPVPTTQLLLPPSPTTQLLPAPTTTTTGTIAPTSI